MSKQLDSVEKQPRKILEKTLKFQILSHPRQ